MPVVLRERFLACWGYFALGVPVLIGAVSPPETCQDGVCDATQANDDSAFLQFQNSAKSDSASNDEMWKKCPFHVDWIVVGGGAGGCAVAAVLADAGEEVTLLERGPSDLEPEMKSTRYMSGWPNSVNDAGEYVRFSEGVWGVVAKVLGGGTSINGGLYIADRPAWFKEHMPGIDQDRLYKSYEAIKRELGTPSAPTEFGTAWNAALEEEDYGATNLNQASLMWKKREPFLPWSTFNASAPGAPRLGASTLLHDRKNLKNLHVITDALVHKVDFEGKRATGVRVEIGKVLRKRFKDVKARKGVIISAGTIMTPQLLQVSGVGPRELLKKIGVKEVSNLPVGSNFVDRLVVPVGFYAPEPQKLTVGYTVALNSSGQSLVEGVGGGQIASELGVASLALVNPKYRDPALRAVLRTIFDALGPKELAKVNQMIQPVSLQTDTQSRGSVEVETKQITSLPNVTANYFASQRDWDSQVERYYEVWALGRSMAMNGFTLNRKPVSPLLVKMIEKEAPLLLPAFSCLARSSKNEVFTRITIPCSPSPYDSEEAVSKYLRDYITSSYHYFGTAYVGGVVDQKDFSVKGTKGLYVVDASVIPAPTNVNPQGTVMTLGHYVGKLLAEKSN